MIEPIGTLRGQGFQRPDRAGARHGLGIQRTCGQRRGRTDEHSLGGSKTTSSRREARKTRLQLLELLAGPAGDPDGLVVAEGEAQGVVPVVAFAVWVVFGVLNRGEVAVGNVVFRRNGPVACAWRQLRGLM